MEKIKVNVKLFQNVILLQQLDFGSETESTREMMFAFAPPIKYFEENHFAANFDSMPVSVASLLHKIFVVRIPAFRKLN